MYFGPPVTGLRNEEDRDVGAAIFYFRRDIKYTKEYYLYSLLSMVAEIGGYVGLLLGVSLFKLTEANNIFIDWYSQRNKYDAEVSNQGNKSKEDIATIDSWVRSNKLYL